MTTDEPLSRQTRSFIVLLALLQGLLLYVADYGQRHDWWPLSALTGRVYWYTLVLVVPGVVLLSVRDLGDRRLWQHTALVTAIFAALAVYAGWSATGAPNIDAGFVLGPFGFGASAAAFVALPFLQCRLEHGRWTAPYADLFEHAWQNGITLALAGLFVGVAWGVLLLWGELFELIRIRFFSDLFRERAFVYLATGCMVGFGVLIARTQRRAVQIARQILLAIGKGLLPVLAFVALLFVAALPFTGLESLWSTKRATLILFCLVGSIVLLVNTVYQDGKNAAPYPRPLRLLVEAAICTLPLFAALAIYAIVLRRQQYGWTSDRVFALLAGIVLAGYALGYAVAALRRRAWTAALGRTNVALALGAIGVVVLASTPLLDPHRIGAASQLERLRADRADVAPGDLDYLRFRAGRRGYAALQELRTDAANSGDNALAARIDRELQRESRWIEWSNDGRRLRANAVKTLDELRGVLELAPGAEAPDDEWLAKLLDHTFKLDACTQALSECVLLSLDIDGDGAAERLVCNIGGQRTVECRITTRKDGEWRLAGAASWYSSDAVGSRIDALRKGKLTLAPQQWPDLVLDGDTSVVRELQRWEE